MTSRLQRRRLLRYIPKSRRPGRGRREAIPGRLSDAEILTAPLRPLRAPQRKPSERRSTKTKAIARGAVSGIKGGGCDVLNARAPRLASRKKQKLVLLIARSVAKMSVTTGRLTVVAGGCYAGSTTSCTFQESTLSTVGRHIVIRLKVDKRLIAKF